MEPVQVPEAREILDLVQDAIFVVDEQGNFLYVSAGVQNLLGYRPAELMGKNMIDFVHPDDRNRTLSRVWQIMEGVSATRFVNRWLHKFGHPVLIEWAASWSHKHRVRVASARAVEAPDQAGQSEPR
jgi:PAS domain S-box-containing protein